MLLHPYWYICSAIVSLGLAACNSLGSLHHHGPTSTLKAVQDQQYSLQLAQIEDLPGLFRFEVCLRPSYAGATASERCIGAFRTNEHTDLIFRAEAVTAMQLTPQQIEELRLVHSEYKDYHDTLNNQMVDQLKLTLSGTAIIIGGNMVGKRVHNYGMLNTQKLERLETQLQEATDNIPRHRVYVQHNRAEYDRLLRLKESLEHRAQMSRVDFLQKEFGSTSLRKVQTKLATYEAQLRKTGFPTTELPQPLPSSLWNHVKVSQPSLSPQSYPTIFSNNFINHYLKTAAESSTLDWDEEATALRALLHDGTIQHPDIVLKQWKELGFTADEIFHQPFRHQLARFFQFNHIEALFHTQLNDRTITHIESLHAALDQGNPQLLSTIAQFSRHRGVSPSAVARIKWVQRYRAMIPLNQEVLLQLEQGTLKPKVMDQQTADLLSEVRRQLAPLDEAMASANQSIADLDQLKSVTRNLSHRLNMAAKFMLGITISRAVGVGLAASGLVGLGLHIVNHNNSVGSTKLTKAEPIMARYKELQVLIDESAAVLAEPTRPATTTSVASVQNLLNSLALWQSTYWVDTQDTGVIITDICLPSLNENNVLISHCQPPVF